MITNSPRYISCHRLIKLLKPYYSSLKARKTEGRPYLMRAIKAILEMNRINVEPVGLLDGTPYDPTTGIGFLLVERCLFIEVVSDGEFDPETRCYLLNLLPFVPCETHYSSEQQLVLNFGGEHSAKYIINRKEPGNLLSI